mmetsp:Transcript_20939/g.59740  ORF Transcript_20939/g.59740 Transcript_20939/m.59740 type:complete len:251 (+) Transcript_20939:466-1218(+)
MRLNHGFAKPPAAAGVAVLMGCSPLRASGALTPSRPSSLGPYVLLGTPLVTCGELAAAAMGWGGDATLEGAEGRSAERLSRVCSSSVRAACTRDMSKPTNAYDCCFCSKPMHLSSAGVDRFVPRRSLNRALDAFIFRYRSASGYVSRFFNINCRVASVFLASSLPSQSSTRARTHADTSPSTAAISRASDAAGDGDVGRDVGGCWMASVIEGITPSTSAAPLAWDGLWCCCCCCWSRLLMTPAISRSSCP